MTKIFRALVVLVCVLLIGSIAGITMVVAAYKTADSYEAHLKLAFNAVAYNYAPGSPETTVRMTVDGAQYEIDIENHKIISFYLTQGTVGSYVPEFLLGGECITASFCGTDSLRVYRVSADKATAVLETGGKKYKVRIMWDDLWENLTDKIMQGYRDVPNTLVNN